MKFLSIALLLMVSLGFVLVGCTDNANPVQSVPNANQGPSILGKAEAVTTNTTIQWAESFDIPCTGDVLNITGEVHFLVHSVTDGNGGFHTKWQGNPQNVVGISSNGVTYRAVGATKEEMNMKVGSTYTFVNRYLMVAAGPSNNLVGKETFRTTVNANGVVSVEWMKSEVECQ
jgi:hypothetical protein